MGSAPQEKNHGACGVWKIDNRQKQRLCSMYLINERWWQNLSHNIAVPHSILPHPDLLITLIRGLFGRHRNCIPAHVSRIPSQGNQSIE